MNIPKAIQTLGREAVIQYCLITYIDMKFKGAVCHFNNNGEDKKIEQIYCSKLLGMKKGFPDLTIIYKGKVLFLEIKSETGKQSPQQKEVEKWITEQEGVYKLAVGMNEALKIVDEYFG